MANRKKKDRGMMWIVGPCREGTLIPKPPVGLFRPKPQRFVNWSLKDDKPFGVDFVREVQRTQYWSVMVARGDIRLATEDEIKEAKEPLAQKAKPKKQEAKNKGDQK